MSETAQSLELTRLIRAARGAARHHRSQAVGFACLDNALIGLIALLATCQGVAAHWAHETRVADLLIGVRVTSLVVVMCVACHLFLGPRIREHVNLQRRWSALLDDALQADAPDPRQLELERLSAFERDVEFCYWEPPSANRNPLEIPEETESHDP